MSSVCENLRNAFWASVKGGQTNGQAGTGGRLGGGRGRGSGLRCATAAQSPLNATPLPHLPAPTATPPPPPPHSIRRRSVHLGAAALSTFERRQRFRERGLCSPPPHRPLRMQGGMGRHCVARVRLPRSAPCPPATSRRERWQRGSARSSPTSASPSPRNRWRRRRGTASGGYSRRQRSHSCRRRRCSGGAEQPRQ